MSEGEDARDRAPPAGSAEPAAAESAGAALARARGHARAALAEALRALEALLDAATLATGGEPAQTHRRLGPLARTLEGLAGDLDGSSRSRPLLAAVAEALDAEIARWELRARDDADARAVLRAFLGLRELLWEFGVRRPESAAAASPAGARPGRPARPARPRVQRVRVEG
jgi:hypothetical protein